MTTLKSDPRSMSAAERRVRAFDLRREGATFRDIEEDLSISAQAAFACVQRELRKLAKLADDEAETLLRLELGQLGNLRQAVWDRAAIGDLRAVDRAPKIMDRGAQLLGLDAPRRVAPTTPGGREPYEGGGLSILHAEVAFE